ncbi:ABC transporter permease [Inmirania thermothiophila]|uniref:Putative ABC transport system permease protein n=1 Tax=Inmirania thermothiophila TaxID=1750597 RepID=A0A3N1Y716_9GAMM|nr:ABC transporter permease [Inmirania thermothiophila]ROR34603.1 putative ABC transport system permease protein [Inmirania thermothiophila]
MRAADAVALVAGSLRAWRARSLLTALGIAVGVAAVVVLTSLGEGLRRYVLAEFTQFGTHLVAVVPGRTTTLGISGAVINTVRPLTLEDAEALERLPEVAAAVPFVQGNAAVEAGGRSRRVLVFGADADLPAVWRFAVAAGRFLPADPPRRARPFAVLGARVRAALFPAVNPLGRRVRIGGERYRVVGVMAPKGQFLGFDLDDAVYIPVGRALAMFDREGLMEVDLLYRPELAVERVTAAVRRLLLARHGGEDFTLVTQTQMLEVLGSVLEVLQLAVAALGAISLLVGGVGILTIMTIGVAERTAEVGLLRALGARRGQILALFLGEAAAVALAGAAAGIAGGLLLALSAARLLPGLPVHVPWGYLAAAAATALAIGLAAGVWPARRAARLDPVEALRGE